MTTSKDNILAAIRNARPPTAPLPALDESWTTYADRQRQFLETLKAVGGTGHVAASRAELDAAVRCLSVYAAARRIVSLVPGVGEANVDLAAAHSPHELADVDLAILPGEFAVAENAAVWITDRGVPHRVIYYLCQHLVLVVPAAEIVDNMHVAYERLKAAGEGGRAAFAEPMFGAFISGPSKTADIEQALVIGAHGPRSLTVCLLDQSAR
jgi:L-lactate dehydrogenase complex protein LldG